jgi:hypothetical protein
MPISQIADSFGSIASFSRAVSKAVEQRTHISKHLDLVDRFSQSARSGLRNIVDNAARFKPISQETASDRQPTSAAIKEDLKWPYGEWESTEETFFSMGIFFAALRVWAGALQSIGRRLLTVWSKLVVPIGRGIVATVARISRFILESEIFGAIAQALEAIKAVLLTLQGALIATDGAVVGVAAYEIWRPRDGVKRVIQNVRSMLTDKERAFGHELAGLGEWFGREHDPSRNPIGWPHYSSPVVLPPNSERNGLVAAWKAVQPRLELFLSGARVQAAATMLAVPLLVTPASPQLSSIRPQYATTKTASVIINSSPTITITGSDCHNIEQRVLAALKEDRQAMFDQWCLELQRRQRTEF